MANDFTGAMIGVLAKVAAERAPLWVALVGCMGLWTWAVAQPQPWRIVAALGATMFMYLPLAFKRGT